jgi:hypothetical protein
LLSQFKIKQQDFAVLQVSCLEFQSKFQWILPARMWELYAGCSRGSGAYSILFGCWWVSSLQKRTSSWMDIAYLVMFGPTGLFSCQLSANIDYPWLLGSSKNHGQSTIFANEELGLSSAWSIPAFGSCSWLVFSPPARLGLLDFIAVVLLLFG